jgi:integrase
MNGEVKVYVVRLRRRPNYVLEWEDPITQKARRKKTNVPATDLKKDRRAAERLAAELALQINNGAAALPSKFLWDEFRRRYEAEVIPGLATQTAVKIGVVLDRVEGILSPKRLLDLTEARLSHLVATMRKQGVAETTMKGYLAHLKAALNWAVSQRLLVVRPNFPRLQRAKRSSGTPMKGRPITSEEFERMLEAVSGVVDDDRADQWRFYLRGLWASGLRLEESLDLWWDQPNKIYPMFPKDGQPLFQIPAELEKGHTDRLLPMAPEFALMLQAVPEAERTGPVFTLHGRQGRLGSNQVSKIVSTIGKAAGVLVSTHPVTGKQKFASAHDLRRAFGERWSIRVMPAVLKELMRHESIDTTMRFYVGTNTQRTNDAVWAAFKHEQERLSANSSDISSDMPLKGQSKPAPTGSHASLENKAQSSTRPGRTRTYDQGIMSPLL